MIEQGAFLVQRGTGKSTRYPIIFECEKFVHDFYIHLCTPGYAFSVPNPSPFYIRMFMRAHLHKYCVLQEFWPLYLYLMDKTICKLEVE